MKCTVGDLIFNGINGFVGWNIQSCMMLAFATHAACLSLPLTAPVEDPVFTSPGFRVWKHATGKTGALFRHSNCYSHKQGELGWSQHKLNSKKGTTKAERLESARSVTISQNCHFIETIADIILLCSRQEIALCGHQESSDSINRSNFLVILHFNAKHNPSVKLRIENGPHTLYLRYKIQFYV